MPNPIAILTTAGFTKKKCNCPGSPKYLKNGYQVLILANNRFKLTGHGINTTFGIDELESKISGL